MSLPIDGRVVHQIATLLAHLDEDGTTLSTGVAPHRPGPVVQPSALPSAGARDSTTA
jgi:hypothetical protein